MSLNTLAQDELPSTYSKFNSVSSQHSTTVPHPLNLFFSKPACFFCLFCRQQAHVGDIICSGILLLTIIDIHPVQERYLYK